MKYYWVVGLSAVWLTLYLKSDAKSDDEPVVVMGASDGSDVIIITAKKEHKIC